MQITYSKPCKHMKDLCKELGPDYSIRMIDLEQVIYCDFGNGYDVEISRMNNSSLKKRASIYLWKDASRIVETVHDVPQCDIGDRVEELYALTQEGV